MTPLAMKLIQRAMGLVGSTGARSANPIKRLGGLVRSGFKVLRTEPEVGKDASYYAADALARAGKLDAKGFAKMKSGAEWELIKESGRNLIKESTNAELWDLRQATGLMKASREVVSKHWDGMLKARDAGDFKAFNRHLKTVIGQIKGQGIADMLSGSKTVARTMTENVFLKPHRLDDEMLELVKNVQLRGASSRIKPIILEAKQMVGSNFANDMQRAETTKMVDWALAMGARKGQSLEEVASWISRDLKHATMTQMRKNPNLRNRGEKELERLWEIIPKPSAVVKGDKLYINDVVMSGDYTAAYAPISTVVKRDFSYKRVLSDMYDGGNTGALGWSDLLSPQRAVSKLRNRAWNVASGGRRFVQVSRQYNGSYLSAKHDPVLTLKNTKFWKNTSKQKKYQDMRKSIKDKTGWKDDDIDNEILLRIDAYAEAKVGTGLSPYKTLENLEATTKGGKIDHAFFKDLLESKDLTAIIRGRESGRQLLKARQKRALAAKAQRAASAERRKLEGTLPSIQQSTSKSFGDKLEPVLKDVKKREKSGITKKNLAKFRARKSIEAGAGIATVGGIYMGSKYLKKKRDK